MKADDIRNIAEAYNSIYEAVTDRPAGSSNTAPYGLDVNPKSKEIRDKLFAQKPTPPAQPKPPAAPVVKPQAQTPVATPVSPGTSSTSTSSVPAASTTTSPAAVQKTFQQELDDLRKASAKATMVGPSKEAQALMSQRTKNILGPEKLAAGIKAQQEVEKMKSEIGAPKPQAPVSSTTQTRQPQPPPPPASATPTLTKAQMDAYNKANDALKGPFGGMVKGQVKTKFKELSPADQAAFREYLKTRPKEDQDRFKYLGEGVDIYDEVLEYLLGEGCTLNESNYIMTYVVEQGMYPQEIVTRGIANMLGLDKPHPTQVFAQGLRKMLYPNKPQEVRAPKAPTPKLTRVASPAAKPTITKPNPYRPGATVRATGPDLNKFPELQRFAGQGLKPAIKPVVGGGQGLSLPVGGAQLGAAVAGIQAYNTGDSTLSAALKRGDYRPMQGPPAPKSPKLKPVVKPATVAPAPKSVVSKPTSQEDPDIKKYNQLRKSDPTKAKELGMKIWSRKYRSALTPPEVA